MRNNIYRIFKSSYISCTQSLNRFFLSTTGCPLLVKQKGQYTNFFW